MAIELGRGARARTGRQLPALIRPCSAAPGAGTHARPGPARTSALPRRPRARSAPGPAAAARGWRQPRPSGCGPMGGRPRPCRPRGGQSASSRQSGPAPRWPRPRGRGPACRRARGGSRGAGRVTLAVSARTGRSRSPGARARGRLSARRRLACGGRVSAMVAGWWALEKVASGVTPGREGARLVTLPRPPRLGWWRDGGGGAPA